MGSNVTRAAFREVWGSLLNGGCPACGSPWRTREEDGVIRFYCGAEVRRLGDAYFHRVKRCGHHRRCRLTEERLWGLIYSSCLRWMTREAA